MPTTSSSSRPSPLAISTAAVRRLLKEESTYRAELAAQESRLGGMEVGGGGGGGGGDGGGGGGEGGGDGGDEGNRAWEIRQEKQAIEETKAVFAPLREKLLTAAENLEQLLGEVDAANELLVKTKDG
ncbi:MAG: hypothetical protein LQ345_002387 [Seirophora villosa]|nr:MAG: hypothetical protein LQ345_002387 [Seirophora villosa]